MFALDFATGYSALRGHRPSRLGGVHLLSILLVIYPELATCQPYPRQVLEHPCFEKKRGFILAFISKQNNILIATTTLLNLIATA